MIKSLMLSMQELIDSGDSTGCTEDLIVCSKEPFDKVSIKLDSIKSLNPTETNPHCPFCFKPMSFTEPSINENDKSIKQHVTCNDCDIMVYIHQFI